MRTREELAWAAGFFEGEGSVRRRHKANGELQGIGLFVGNTDPTSLSKFRDAVGVGKIYGPYDRNRGHKLVYQYWAGNFETAQAVAAMLWSWLSERRKTQIEEMLRDRGPGMGKGPRPNARRCNHQAVKT